MRTYTQQRRLETVSHTLLDLILLDRLENLEDETAYYRLSLKPEVPISVIIESTHGEEEEISGRIDWALNYDAPRNIKLGSILVVGSQTHRTSLNWFTPVVSIHDRCSRIEK
jgi:hypothetical protein